MKADLSSPKYRKRIRYRTRADAHRLPPMHSSVEAYA